MNNAWTVILRAPCMGLRTALVGPARQFLPVPFATQQHPGCDFRKRLLSCTAARPAKSKPKPLKSVPNTKDRHASSKPNPHGTSNSELQNNHKPASRKLENRDVKRAKSYPWGRPLSQREVWGIFGDGVNQADGNGLLSELQDRRVSGSLSEYGISFAEAVDITEGQAMAGLNWLRLEYPIDEAGAAREYAQQQLDELQREESEKLVKWGLLKKDEEYQPQTGESRYGRSVVQEAAQQWQADRIQKKKQKEEEAKLHNMEIQKNVEEKRLSIGQQFVELDVQKEEKYKYWDELKKAAELPADKVIEKRSAFSRLFKPTLFSLSIILAAALLSDPTSVVPPQGLTPQSWKIPSADDITPSMVTCAAITAINLVLYVAWRNPRLWRSMNRNFLLSAGVPNSFSMLGSVFSHQFWVSHLFGNTLFLFVVGMPLHDEIGRLNFLALYLGMGVFGSLTSLYWNVLRRNLLVATLGASGATSGLFGAYFSIQPQRDMYVPFTNMVIPYDSWFAIAGFVALEMFTMWRSGGKLFDHPAHLGGLAAGVVAGWALRMGNPKGSIEPAGHARTEWAETASDGELERSGRDS